MKVNLLEKYPDRIQIRKSGIEQAGMGSFSKVFIPGGLKIGEYIGKFYLPDDFDNKRSNTDYGFSVRKGHKVLFVLDAANKKYANWTRYINCARNSHEENVKFFQYKQRIYVKIIKRYKSMRRIAGMVWIGVLRKNFVIQYL